MEPSKYTDVFVEEAEENLETLNRLLLALEEGGYDEEAMHEAYRVVHTLKGNASALGFEAIADLAHAMEDAFDRLRSQKAAPEAGVLDLLFEGADRIAAMTAELAAGDPIATSGEDVAARLRTDGGAERPAGKKRKKAKKAKGKAPKKAPPETKGPSIYEVRVEFEEDLRFKEGRAFQLVRRLGESGDVIDTDPEVDDLSDDIEEMTLRFATDQDGAAIAATAEEVTGIANATVAVYGAGETETAPTPPTDGAPPPPEPASTVPKQYRIKKAESIRVKSAVLDDLLDLVGEILINDIRGAQMAKPLGNRELLQLYKSRARLVGDLQHLVLRMRMVPMDQIFRRFPRMLRDMAKASGKAVDFQMSGNDIEIDRGLLDNLGEVLVHLLRNAVDHGLEPEAEREAAGKPAEGAVALRVERRQSDIVITVQDDGRGWDADRLAEKAVARGLVTADEVGTMDEPAILNLAFHPGISTAEEVTEYSGRGVGLDAVKTTVESMGGTVSFSSIRGEGTTFTLTLPPSVATIGAMLVEVNGERYGVPLDDILETARLPTDEVIHFAEDSMFRLRGEVLPLINIHEAFGGTGGGLDGTLPVLVVEKGDQRAGLVVSDFLGQQEIVVKTLGKELSGSPHFSGATILGDGRVAMILDVGAWL